jgi:hypothetical protein
MLPAGRYSIEIHRIGPADVVASIDRPAYVLHATPYLQRRTPRALAVPADTATTQADGEWYLMLVIAIPVETE